MIDWFLPGTKAGGPVRSIYSLMNLLKDEFEFYLITTNQDLGSKACYENVPPDTLIMGEQINYYYFSKETLNNNTMLALLEQIKPDLVYLNSFWSLHFSIHIIRAKRNGLIKAPVLLAPRGMLGRGAMGLKSFKKRLFLLFAQQLGWYDPVLFHATQQQERNDILEKFPAATIYIAPNVNASGVVENESLKVPGELKLFFLSRVDRVKNLYGALEILQLLPASCRVSYAIFGNLENAGYWRECQALIAQLPANVTVTYKGELPFYEVQHSICRYNFLFLPTLNENFGHSIVESLLCGCPAIISDQTPWNDLEANNAGYAIALTEKQRFADALVQCAALDQIQFSKKSKAAIDYIRNKIDLQAVRHQYKTLLNDCIKN